MQDKIEILEVEPILSDDKILKKEGEYFPESHYSKIINYDCDVYGIMDNERKLLLKFRKSVIPNKICIDAYNALEQHAQHKNYNRGASAGKVKINKLPGHVGKITKRDSFRIYYKTIQGKTTRDNVGNMAKSNIAGYYDKPDRNEYLKIIKKIGKTGKTLKLNSINKHGNGTDKLGVPLCRTTQFTKDQVEKWEKTVPFIIHADKQFKSLVPDRHRIQLQRANKTPQFKIASTAYSTITINYDWRTALHKDKGDLEEGFGNLLVLEKAKSGYPDCKGYIGGYLGFPRWGIAVDVRQGDFLAMDVHEWHCNTPINGTGRLSVVCYLRKGMIKCSSITN